MKKTLLKSSFLLMVFLFSLTYLTENYKITNEEHPEINSLGNTILLANEEHPVINSLGNTILLANEEHPVINSLKKYLYA